MPMAIPTRPVARVGINGFGRIGRAAFRLSLTRDDIDVVAINHTAPTLEHLLHVIRYDSTHGPLAQIHQLALSDDKQYLIVNGRAIRLFSERDPTKLQWAGVGAEYIVESTGKMTTVELAERHISGGGAKKVVITAPSKDAPTFVYGVNDEKYESSMNVVSNASCTTNCLAPLAKVLDNAFGINTGMMTTVHAATSSQHILDGYSKKSRRLGRAIQSNIIPTSTGAATAVQLVLPNLAGKFTGISVRVPVSNVSLVDLTVTFTSPIANKEALLAPLLSVTNDLRSPLSRVLSVNDDELVSSDFCGTPHSCVVDASATVVLDEHTAKVLAWYDNEWAYACRVLDLVSHMCAKDSGVMHPEPVPTVPTPISSIPVAASA